MRDKMCFACSPQNSIGLHLKFVMENETANKKATREWIASEFDV